MNDHPSAPKNPKSLKNPRYVRQVPFSLRVISDAEGGESAGETLEGESHDISVGGLRFQDDLSLSSGTEVELTLRLSPSFEPTVGAQVIRLDTVADETGESLELIALQFTGLEPGVESQLRDFLAPKFSFQKGGEEAEEAEAVEMEPGTEPEGVQWSSMGVTILKPGIPESRSEEDES